MDAFVETMNGHLNSIVHLVSMVISLLGMVVILVSILQTFIAFFRHDDAAKNSLEEGIMLGIKILIGAEIMHTITTGTLNDVLVLGLIVLIRIVLTLVLHWEVTSSEKDKKKEETPAIKSENE